MIRKSIIGVGRNGMRKRKLLCICIGLVVVLILFLFHVKQVDAYKCKTCQSKQTFHQWRFGELQHWSFALSPKRERIDETQLLRHAFAPDHKHEWVLRNRSQYRFFGTTFGSCALGVSKDSNDFCFWYENSFDFRVFIQGKIDDGGLRKDTLRRIAGLPPWRSAQKSPDAAEADLIDQAKGLIQEAGLPD